MTYGELVQSAKALAGNLACAGIGRGDTVGVLMEHSVDSVIAYYGAQWVGAIVMPLNAKSEPAVVKSSMQRTGARALLVRNGSQARRFGANVVSGGYRLFAFEKPPVPASHWGYALSESAAGDPAPCGGNDISLVLFTTGTTGSPKGVLLSHSNVLAATAGIVDFMQIPEETVEVVPAPLYHSFGLARMRTVFSCRGTLILTNGFTFPRLIYDAVERYRADGFASVSAGWEILLRADRARMQHAFRSLCYAEIGSAPLRLEQKLEILRMLPRARVCMHYGLTEASRSMFCEFHEAADDLTTIGRPLKGVEASIRDARGRQLKDGKDGEICIKGPTVFVGYLNDPEATKEAFFGDWLRTGDIGRRAANGAYYLTGRIKELINLGGTKVSPLDIESVLNICPGVLESAVVGVPSRRDVTGEQIHAFVVAEAEAKLNPDDVIRFAAKRLEPLLRPTFVSVVRQLPKTASGKIQRMELRRSIDAK